MAMVAVKGIGTNFVQVGAIGLSYWFSYGECVAVSDGRTTYFCTSPRGGGKWSKSTQNHLQQLLDKLEHNTDEWMQKLSAVEFDTKVAELERIGFGMFADLEEEMKHPWKS